MALCLSVLDVHGLGLAAVAGTMLTKGFYWDFYTLLDTTSGTEAFRPLAAGGCPRLLQ